MDAASESADGRAVVGRSVLDSSSRQRAGITGLMNLTNSCYMNCTLQCLSHCKALTNYFLRGLFIDEINTDNALGT